MMHLEQESQVQVKPEADMFQWFGVVLMVLMATIGWYALFQVCYKDFTSGKDTKWIMATPFLALLSFYIYRDFYRMLKAKLM